MLETEIKKLREAIEINNELLRAQNDQPVAETVTVNNNEQPMTAEPQVEQTEQPGPLTQADLDNLNNLCVQVSGQLGDNGTAVFAILKKHGLGQLGDIAANRELFDKVKGEVDALVGAAA